MVFRGEAYVFDSPAAAAGGMLARAARANPDIEECPLESARGRVLAEPARADRASPPFDYSSMDGYAVRVADLAAAFAAHAGQSVTLRVTGESRIGRPPPAPMLSADSTSWAGVVRIVTGAAIPLGADAVIKRENVTEHGEDAHGGGTAPRQGAVAEAIASPTIAAITLTRDQATKTRAGENIRRRGDNAPAGAVVLDAGSMLTAASIGMLAAVGLARPRVFARHRVAIITTGDEVVPPESAPDPFQIRDSNLHSLRGILSAQPWIEVVSAVHVPDDGADLTRVLRTAIDRADAVIVSGGISMGHRDPVRGAVEESGAEVVFHGLPQRPGKPMLGAVAPRRDGTRVPIFCLPGNPVSAMVTCTRIVLPVLAVNAGMSRRPAAPRVALANPDGQTLDLWWHRLVRINGRGAAELVETRSSGDIVAGGASDGFIEVPPGHSPAGLQYADAPALYSFYPWPA